MVATLHLVRWPLGVGQIELWQAQRRREAFGAATFDSLLLPLALPSMALPAPRLRAFGYLAVWPSAGDAERFAASPLARRWLGAGQCLALTLQPIHGFGAWRGMQPLQGQRTESWSGPVLQVTHSRTRPSKLVPFLRGSGRVAVSLPSQPGCLWADGFADRILTLDTGTLSLWRDAGCASRFAYGAGVHQDAVRAERRGRWFAEAWFGRFGVVSVSGDWPGVEIDALSRG